MSIREKKITDACLIDYNSQRKQAVLEQRYSYLPSRKESVGHLVVLI